MDFGRDLALVDAELLQIPGVIASPNLAQYLFEHWFSLPPTITLVKSLVNAAKAGNPLNVHRNATGINAASGNSILSMYPAGSAPPLSPRSSSCSPRAAKQKTGLASLGSPLKALSEPVKELSMFPVGSALPHLRGCSSGSSRAAKQRTGPSSVGSPLKVLSEPVEEMIPQFYFQNGYPAPKELKERCLFRISLFFYGHNEGLKMNEFKAGTKEICKLPSFFSAVLFQKIDINGTGFVTRDAFVDYWVDGNMLTMDKATQVYTIMKQPHRKCLTQDDFKPVLNELLATHPGLKFLQSTPEFQKRYAETVVYRIFFYINRAGDGQLTLRELKRGNLIAAMQHADEEEDINKVLRYFSYEHFYVIYCKFWELDTDHDFLIDKDDLIRYGNHALTYRIVDRILAQAPRKFISTVEGKLGYEDFVYFILAEEDKSSESSLEYWFKCIDLDGNSVITRNEMKFFYEEQLHRMECMAQEPVLFEDILCQIIDMIMPENESYSTLRDLKGSRLSGSVFNILFNLNKFMAFETRSIPYSSGEGVSIPDGMGLLFSQRVC